MCLNCGNSIKIKKYNDPKRKKYCDHICAKEFYKKEYRKRNNVNYDLPTASVGAMNELFVAYDLIKKGKHVFRALSPAAPCDLAILEDGKLRSVEVRTGYFSFKGHIRYSQYGKADIWAVVIGHEITYFGL